VKYKECRNIVVKELKAARKKFECKLAADIKGNPKLLFRYVRSKTKSKERVGPLKDLAGNILDDDSSMCKTLNTYFASVITKEKTDNIPEVKQVFHGGSSRLLSLIDITPDDVFKQISRIKDGKAPGDDSINSAFLKHIASEISEPLSIIYNKSVT